MSMARTIQVSDGIYLAYLDSGPPPLSSTYTTLLLVHGLGWNANIFQKIIDAAPSRGLRVIAFQRRPYGDSTPFSDDELAPLQADDAAQRGGINLFLEERALELANFIKKIVQAGDLPKPKGGKGGIALVCWSLGNTFGLDFLSRIPRMPSELKDPLRTHISGCIIYDPPIDVFCIQTPHPSGIAFTSVLFQRAEAAGESPEEAINNWVSSWNEYSHPDSADLAERYDHFNEGVPARAPLRQLEAENPALQACISYDRCVSDLLLLPAINTRLYKDNLEKTLYEDPAKTYWPGMKVEYLCCANSVWSVIYAADTIRERFEGAVPGRKIKVVPEASHFLHWEDPDRCLDVLKSIV